MKISFNNNNHKINSSKQPLQGQNKNNTQDAIKGQNNFDTISIQSNPSIMAERKFAASLTSEIISQVRQPSSQDKINALQKKVAAGQYHPDPQKIASKILLIGEDE